MQGTQSLKNIGYLFKIYLNPNSKLNPNHNAYLNFNHSPKPNSNLNHNPKLLHWGQILNKHQILKINTLVLYRLVGLWPPIPPSFAVLSAFSTFHLILHPTLGF